MKKIFVLICVLFSNGLIAQKTYLHCGSVFDSKSGKIKKELTIVVEGEKINKILKGYVTPEEGSVAVNLKDKTVYPGFIDMHVHIESESSPSRYLDRYRLNDADVAFDAARFAHRTLQAGFTSVRDLGGSGVNIALRNAILLAKFLGPAFTPLGKPSLLLGDMAILQTGIVRRFKGTLDLKKA